MLKLKYNILRNEHFNNAMLKLVHYPAFKSPIFAYNVAKINIAVQNEVKPSEDVYLKLVKAHCKMDEKGEIAPREMNGAKVLGTFEVRPEAIPEWEKGLAEYNDLEFEVKAFKIPLHGLEGISLSPLELTALESLLSVEDAPEVAK